MLSNLFKGLESQIKKTDTTSNSSAFTNMTSTILNDNFPKFGISMDQSMQLDAKPEFNVLSQT